MRECSASTHQAGNEVLGEGLKQLEEVGMHLRTTQEAAHGGLEVGDVLRVGGGGDEVCVCGGGGLRRRCVQEVQCKKARAAHVREAWP